jgi:hypothetical protein
MDTNSTIHLGKKGNICSTMNVRKEMEEKFFGILLLFGLVLSTLWEIEFHCMGDN